MMPKRILMPYDGSWADDQLLRAVCRLARARRAELHVVHVLEVPMSLGLDAGPLPGSGDAQRMLDSAEETAREMGVSIRTELMVSRDAGHSIVEAARQFGSDLIVMEAQQTRSEDGSGLGRIAGHVFSKAECAVWVSRTAAERQGDSE